MAGKIARTAILFLFVFAVGCLEGTDDCIQHVNMDTNGNIYYTFEGENCAGAVYPPNQAPVMVQFGDSYLGNAAKAKDGK
jgi:hypothetical protein